ncbi:hypothetical protein Ocin01_06119, partial [Orchesella cincta]
SIIFSATALWVAITFSNVFTSSSIPPITPSSAVISSCIRLFVTSPALTSPSAFLMTYGARGATGSCAVVEFR